MTLLCYDIAHENLCTDIDMSHAACILLCVAQGASIIRMLRNFIGVEAFRSGITVRFKPFKINDV